MSTRATDNRQLLAGLIMLPAILFQGSLLLLLIQTGCVILFAVRAGRRFRLLPNLIILVSVVIANSIQVNGRVLFSIGSFDLTLGAVELGLMKAVKLIAMVYLSQFMVAGRPFLPGRFGALVSMQFVYFEHIMELWGSRERKDRKSGKPGKSGKSPGEKRSAYDSLITRLDELLLQLERMELQDVMGDDNDQEDDYAGPFDVQNPERASLLELSIPFIIVWGALVIGVLA